MSLCAQNLLMPFHLTQGRTWKVYTGPSIILLTSLSSLLNIPTVFPMFLFYFSFAWHLLTTNIIYFFILSFPTGKMYVSQGLDFFKRYFIYLFLEREEGRKKGKQISVWLDTLICCLSNAPNWGPGPQPRHVPRLGAEPVMFRFTGQYPIHWATPARSGDWIFIFSFLIDIFSIAKHIVSIQ